jgi:hypothetical protein
VQLQRLKMDVDVAKFQRIARRFRGALQNDELFQQASMLLLTASFDLENTRLNSADADFEATLGQHKSGIALLQVLGFDAVADAAPEDASASTISATASPDAVAAAPGVPVAATDALPTVPSTEGADAAPGDAAATSDAAADSSASATPATDTGAVAPAKRATIYAFKGGPELQLVVPRLVTMLLDLAEGPMPPKPADDSEEASAGDAAEDESALTEEEKTKRSLLRQCVPTRFTHVDFEGSGLEILEDKFMTMLTNHPGTLIGMVSVVAGDHSKESVARLLVKLGMITPIFTGPEGARATQLRSVVFREAVALQAVRRMAPDMAGACLLSRWTTCLHSKALSAAELVNEIMKHHGPRLRAKVGSDVAAKLFVGIRNLPFVPPPAEYAKVEGLPEVDMDKLHEEARKAALRGIEVHDSDVAVNVVDSEAHTSTTPPDVIDAVVMQSHQHEVEARLKALEAV